MSDYAEFDSGQEHTGLEASQDGLGQAGEHDQEYGAFGEVETHEHHEKLVHVHKVEWTDSEGRHFEETDVEYFEETDIDTHATFAEVGEIGEIGHASENGESFAGIASLKETFDVLFGGHEPVQQALGASEDYSPDVSN
jgi:hypothetical protein